MNTIKECNLCIASVFQLVQVSFVKVWRQFTSHIWLFEEKNHQFNLLNYCSALLNWRHIASPALWVYNTLGYTLVCFSRALLCRCRVVTLGCFGGTWWGLKRALSQVPIDHATRNWVSIRQVFFIALWIIIRGIPCDIYKDYVGNEQYKRQNRHFLLGRHW